MAQVKPINVKTKYKVLTYTAYILYVLSALCILGGLFGAGASGGTSGMGEQSPMAAFMGGSMIFAGLIGGLLFGIQAQLLLLFVNIELNQRQQIEFTIQLIEAMPDKAVS
jgi:hypothetical protein